jgi:hypothetical protein
MSNEYFTKSGYPSTSARAVSASLRAEIANIEAGFDKMPVLAGNGGEIIAVNSGATALESIATTGTGSAVRATSPTLVTPTLGVATATSINGVTITGSGTIASGAGGIAATIDTAVSFADAVNCSPTGGAPYASHHIRVANMVLLIASGSFSSTSTGNASFTIALPVSTAKTTPSPCVGVFVHYGSSTTQSGNITLSSSTKALVSFRATAFDNGPFSIILGYVIE